MPFRPRRPLRPRAPVVPFLAARALALGAAFGCARAPTTVQPAPVASWPAECLVGQVGTSASDTITAAFADSADARRARLATLRTAPVRFDCTGRAWPGLAASWSRDTSGRFWTIGLRAPTTDDTTTRWTAGALATAWRADSAAAMTLRHAGVAAVLPLDDQRIVVELTRPSTEVPRVLGDRMLGVPKAAPVTSTLASLTFGDLRDAVDRGIDVVQATDPGVLDYARRGDSLNEVPLPWSRAYVLLLPAGAEAALRIPADTAALRASLAGDAVSAVAADARAAAAPFWWDGAGCPPWPAPRPRQDPAEVIAYRADDPVAGALAERLVALTASGLRARGMPSDSFGIALRLGTARAFVVSMPRAAPVPCRELAGWPARPTVVPLIDTRAHLFVRHGTGTLAVEWDGAVRPASIP